LFTDSYFQAFDSVIRSLGVSAYLCGGTVRDLLISRPIHDVDLVLSDRVFEAAQQFASSLHLPFFVMDQERQVARVVCESGNWDFTGYRNHTLEGDLAKRDFTINAMAIRWQDFYLDHHLTVVDPHAGQRDLQARLIRPVNDSSLQEDPLRMLRAFRIQAELHFGLDPSLIAQIGRVHSRIGEVAAERVTEELDRILLQPDSANAWNAIAATPLFDSLFPELVPMKGCEQGGYHHLDVWNHTVLALQNFEEFLSTIGETFGQDAQSLKEYLESSAGTLDRKRLLKWVVLLHDSGKPQTRELKEPGRWRFHGHEHTGSNLAQALLKRLKFARKDAQLVSLLIEQHLRPLQFFNQPDRDEDSRFRFLRAIGAEAAGLLLVSYADLTSARGPLSPATRESEYLKYLQEMMRFYYSTYYPAVHTPELLKGRDLMAVLQMKSGPEMGELLREIREAQLLGKLKNRDEALAYARKWRTAHSGRREKRIEDRG
jgi:tRNA nucleotidyltransferase/poly(A) polymerase